MINGITGVRYARNCHPDNLWTSYFTSSKYVQEYREKYGEPDVIEIRQTFNDSCQAREWEHKVLRRMKVIQNDKWLNRGTGKSIPSMFGKNHWAFEKGFSEEHKQKLRKPKSEEHKQKLSNARKGKPGHLHSKETKQKLREINLGKKHTEEARNKIREKRKNQILTDKQIETLKTNNLGKKFTEEHKQKMSKSQKGRTFSEEHKSKLRKPKSEETKAKMSESRRRKETRPL